MFNFAVKKNMIAREDYIRERFREYNAAMFGGRLPEPPIELTPAKTFLGQCRSQISRLTDGRKVHGNFRLRFSTSHDLPEAELQDTVIHEMIHYFILLNGLVDTSTHGKIFKSLMRSINANFNRNIAISHHGAPGLATAQKRKTYVVARIALKSGKTGFKVIPNTRQSINRFMGAIKRVAEVKEVKLHVSDNPFFGHYPSSAALKIHLIDAALLDANLGI